MYSNKNSKVIENELNSMNNIGKKLSHLALKNISLNNPSQNSDFELPLNKLNALPTIPNTINKIPISKTNYVQSNADIDDFLSQINEADKTLQMLSVVVNNVDVLKGGAENDDEYNDSGFMKRWDEKYKKIRDEQEKINRQEDSIRERLQEIEENKSNNKPDNKTPGDKRNDDDEDEDEDEDEENKTEGKNEGYDETDHDQKDDKLKLNFIESEYDYLYEFNEIYNPTEETLNRCENNGISYNADKVIRNFQLLDEKKDSGKKGDKGIKTSALNYLRKVYGEHLTDEQIINKIPDDIQGLPQKNEYEKTLKDLENEHEIITDRMSRREENTNLKMKTKTLEKKADIIDFFKSKEPIINGMSKFNSQMNRLYVFFKGKIKPNLKIISQKDISNALQDMMTLISNFKDVYSEIERKFHNVFGVERLSKTTKADQFLSTFESNFIKISSDIISNLKSYSSIGTFSEGNNILQVNPSGGLLIPNIIRKRLHLKNKYLL